MSEMLNVADDIAIPMAEIDIQAVRAQGSGGQNVNKVASAVHLCFDVLQSSALPDSAKKRLLQLNDRRISADGIVTIKAQEYRSQARNRAAALDRLRELLAASLVETPIRVPTKVPDSQRRKRVADKRRRGRMKRDRARVEDD